MASNFLDPTPEIIVDEDLPLAERINRMLTARKNANGTGAAALIPTQPAVVGRPKRFVKKRRTVAVDSDYSEEPLSEYTEE
jgi:hypothetical protein